VIETLKKGVLRYRTPLKKLTSGLPKGSPSRPRSCLNANQQSDSFTSLEIAPRNSNHIPAAPDVLRPSFFVASGYPTGRIARKNIQNGSPKHMAAPTIPAT
jgi:hypothetical protein